MPACATSGCGRGQRSLLAGFGRALWALALAAALPAAAQQVVNTASAVWGSPARTTMSNQVLVQVQAPAPGAPRFAVTITNSQPQAAPGQPVKFNVSVASGAAPANPTGTPWQLNGAPSSFPYVLAQVPTGSTFLQATPTGLLYHWAGEPATSLHTSLPPAGTKVDAVGMLLSAVPPNGSAGFAFTVSADNTAQVYQGGVTLQVQATVNAGTGGGATVTISPPVSSVITGTPAVLRLYADASSTVAVDSLVLGRTGFLKLEAPACNDNSPAAVTRSATITTLGGDLETIKVTQVAPGSDLFTIPRLPTSKSPAIVEDGKLESLTSTQARVAIQGCLVPVELTFQLIDPRGTVFDSRTDNAVDGVVVTLYKAAGGACTRQRATVFTYDALGVLVSSPNPFVSAGGGQYEFPLVEAGSYCLAVTPTARHAFPSTIPFAAMSPLRVLQPGSIGLPFQVGPDPAPVVVDLPVDSDAGNYALFVEKKSDTAAAVVGEQLDFKVSLKNLTATPLAGVRLADTMSAGLSYVRGTARINGSPSADPQVAGGALVFTLPDLPAQGGATVSYRAAVGPAAQRKVSNAAMATSGALRSNVASVVLDVVRGFETDNRGVLTGMVHLGCHGLDDDANPGVPGVRLLLEDGTSVTTDRNGRFSRYGLRPGSHVLKVDMATLPAGARLARGERGLMLVDLKDGELFKRNVSLDCTPEVRQEAAARAAKLVDDEAFRALDRSFAPSAIALQKPGAAISTAASGLAGTVAATAATTAVPAAAGSRLTQEQRPAVRGEPNEAAPPAPLLAAAPVQPVPFEEVLSAVADNRAAFLLPVDGQLLPMATTLVRVKVPQGSEVELRVNGELVPATQVGKKAALAERQLVAMEFVAVRLRPGLNKLTLAVKDPWGNVRPGSEINVRAPGELARLQIEPVESPLLAGGSPYARVRLRAWDANDLPVTSRIPVQLLADGALWSLPGGELAALGQAFIENGSVELAVTRPKDPARVAVTAAIGQLKAEAILDFLPRLQPLVGAGVVEGIVRFTGGSLHAVLPTTSLDAFSQELRGVSRALGSNGQAGARAAFFLKGKVKGDYLLTLAYDSDKTTRDQLFRDISPDDYYPVYGDSSVRQFDAQSVSKLYVRVDKAHDWLLVGDFNTQPSQATGLRPVLSAYSRPVNGVAAHVERGGVTAEGFVLRDTTQQRVIEFAPNGTSGPYAVAVTGLLANSERVEVLARDRLNTNIVLRRATLVRFQDYELEALGGRLLFSGPVAMFDAEGNPQTVRVSYEVEGNGESFTTAGGQVSLQVAPGTTVAARLVREDRPDSPYTLQGAMVETQLGPALKLSAELAHSSRGGEPVDAGKAPGSGSAARVEVRGQVGPAEVALSVTAVGTGFENASLAGGSGRRDVVASASMAIGEGTRAVAKLSLAEDLRTGGLQEAAYAGVETAVAPGTTLEAGARVLRQSQAAVPVPVPLGSGEVDTTTLRARATTQFAAMPNLSAWAEGEQAIVGQGRMAALGATYQLTPSTKAYGRTELVNTLPILASSAASRQATAIGIDSSYSESGRAFGELRETVSQGERAPGAAYGVREGLEPWKGIRFTGGIERVQALGQSAQAGIGDSVALTSSASIAVSDAWRANVRAERSLGTDTQSTLLTGGLAYRFDDHWTGLAREVFFDQKGADGTSRIQSRLQLGAAWRSMADDALMVAESRREPADDGTKDTEIVSLQYGRALSTSLRASARLAGRFSRLRAAGLDTTASAWLASGRLSFNLTRDASLGFSVQMVRAPAGQGWHLGTGIEAGYRVAEGLWLVVGYDFARVRDNILQGPGSARGAFLRVRYIFDETVLDIPEPK